MYPRLEKYPTRTELSYSLAEIQTPLPSPSYAHWCRDGVVQRKECLSLIFTKAPSIDKQSTTCYSEGTRFHSHTDVAEINRSPNQLSYISNI